MTDIPIKALRPGAETGKRRREEILRVDHAGELGAVRIYQGQLAVLGAQGKTARSAGIVAHMAEQEKEHKERFDKLLNENASRPTLLEPLWSAAGFALGAATALLGEKAAMAATVAVEEVIDAHYQGQIDEISESDPAAGGRARQVSRRGDRAQGDGAGGRRRARARLSSPPRADQDRGPSRHQDRGEGLRHMRRGYIIAAIALALLTAACSSTSYRTLGRYSDYGGVLTFAWPASGIEGAFKARRVSARIEDSGNAILDVAIDGRSHQLHLEPGLHDYTLFSSSRRETHIIRVTRRSEVGAGLTTIHMVKVDGSWHDLPRPAHRILFVGDSITVGYGNEGADEKCHYSARRAPPSPATRR